MTYIVGIDEAGRGPLAGPVAVGVVAVSLDFDWSRIEGVRDSKKLSEKKREQIFEKACELAQSGALQYAVRTSSAAYIDTYGIVPAIKRALAEAIESIALAPTECRVLLDGGLKAPDVYSNQETIIRGDSTEPTISLASIMAKVTRDRMMVSMSQKYPNYDFAGHKGYGTAKHLLSIKKHGISSVHRRTFCKTLIFEGNSV